MNREQSHEFDISSQRIQSFELLTSPEFIPSDGMSFSIKFFPTLSFVVSNIANNSDFHQSSIIIPSIKFNHSTSLTFSRIDIPSLTLDFSMNREQSRIFDMSPESVQSSILLAGGFLISSAAISSSTDSGPTDRTFCWRLTASSFFAQISPISRSSSRDSTQGENLAASSFFARVSPERALSSGIPTQFLDSTSIVVPFAPGSSVGAAPEVNSDMNYIWPTWLWVAVGAAIFLTVVAVLIALVLCRRRAKGESEYSYAMSEIAGVSAGFGSLSTEMDIEDTYENPVSCSDEDLLSDAVMGLNENEEVCAEGHIQ
jgi:hypothetical protein